MTAIAWRIQPEEIWLMADTMASTGEGPTGEQNKILPIHHLDTMICTVGDAFVLGDWYHYLITGQTLSSLHELNSEGEVFLSYMFSRQHRKHPMFKGLSSRVYHFGFDGQNRRMAGYVLESPKFSPVTLAEVGADPTEPALDISSHEAMKAKMVAFKVSHPRSVGIALQLAILRNGQFTLQTYHTFSDKQSLLSAAPRGIPSTKENIGPLIRRLEHYNRTGKWLDWKDVRFRRERPA
jgi:hypothetical protein